MKATELRIWSKVYYEGRVVEVTAITRSGIFTDNRKCGFNQINPIELTEEWLLKFGFKRINCGIGWDEISNGKVKLNEVPTNKGKFIAFHY
jgi:hypothetical protein